ncbi:MAG: hypothetical protein ACXAEU_22750 [Candidatus Hodarchaeales archaeon]
MVIIIPTLSLIIEIIILLPEIELVRLQQENETNSTDRIPVFRIYILY